MQSWPDNSLVASTSGAVVEWGDNRIRVWRFDGGASFATVDLDAGVSPVMRGDGGLARHLDRDDIFVLDGGRVILDAEREVLFLDDALGSSPQLSRRSFGAQVASVRGRLVSVEYLGSQRSRVCLGLGETACKEVSGLPAAVGEDGVWFVGSVWATNFVSSVSFLDNGPLVASALFAEDLVPAEDGSQDTPGAVPRKLDGGEELHGHWRRLRTQTRQGGCLFYDVRLDGGLIPRMYPEVGELEPPFVSWNLPQGVLGDGEGEWRWCVKQGAGLTSIYRAPAD